MTITFQVHKLTGAMHGEDVSLLDFGYYSLAGARDDLGGLRDLHPEAEFKLVVLGATHLPHSETSMGALCGATDGPLTEGDAVKEDPTCPVCREIVAIAASEITPEEAEAALDDEELAAIEGPSREELTERLKNVEDRLVVCGDGNAERAALYLRRDDLRQKLRDLPVEIEVEAEIERVIEGDVSGLAKRPDWILGDGSRREETASYGIQSIETGVVFARQGADSAAEAERLFQSDNPEYDRPGLIRAVPGFPRDAELGRSPLIEREPTLKETAAALARNAEAKVEETIAHLERAFELADRDLTAAKDAEDPILIALRTSIVDATGRSLAEQRTLLAQYKAVQ